MSKINERPVWDEAKDAAQDPLWLRGLTDRGLLVLRDRLNGWQPTLSQHTALKKKAKVRLFQQFEERGIDPDTPVPFEEFDPDETAQAIMDECFVFTLILGQPSFAKRLPAEQVIATLVNINAPAASLLALAEGEQPEAEVELKTAKVKAKTLNIRQELISKSELDDFETNTRQMKAFLRALSIPSRVLAGQPRRYLLRVGDYEEVMQEFGEFKQRRLEFIDKLGERWDEVLEAAREDRGEFFREEDYQSFAAYRVGFKCDYWVEDLVVSEDLQKRNSEMYASEMKRVRAECAAEAQFLRDTLRMNLQKLIEDLVEMVSPSEDGRQKRFSGARVSALQEFVKVLGDKDLTGDEELALVAEKAAALCSGIDPHSFRDDLGYREGLKQKFEQVKLEASKMVVVRTRKFNLSAED